MNSETMTTPVTTNTMGTSHFPDRPTRLMIFPYDPRQEAARHQTVTSSANTTTVTAPDAGPIVRNSEV